MKFPITLMAALLCAAAPALAQAPASSAPPAHQPGVAAQHQPAPSAVSAAAPPSLEAKVDPAKEAAIRHLMDVTETSKLGDNINAYLTERVRTIMSHSSLSADKLPKFMETFSQRFAAASPSTAVSDAMVPIYARAFTMEDIQAISKFYESPVGQKMVKVLPQVTEESQNTGVQIEQNAVMSVLEGMQDDYPELRPMLHPQTPAPAAPGATPSPEAAPPQK